MFFGFLRSKRITLTLSDNDIETGSKNISSMVEVLDHDKRPKSNLI